MVADRSKADVTKEKIIKSAHKLARKYGYSELTLRDIAEDIGIKAGSIYYHFESRDEIIRAVLASGVEPAIEAVKLAIDKLGADASPVDKLEAALRVHLKYVSAHHFSSALEGIRQLPKKLRDEHMERERVYGKIFKDLIEEMAEAGLVREGANLNVLRMLSLGALTWVSEWYDPHGPLDLDEILDTYMVLLRDGVIAAAPATARAPRRTPKRRNAA